MQKGTPPDAEVIAEFFASFPGMTLEAVVLALKELDSAGELAQIAQEVRAEQARECVVVEDKP
jgi:hypothetical protein